MSSMRPTHLLMGALFWAISPSLALATPMCQEALEEARQELSSEVSELPQSTARLVFPSQDLVFSSKSKYMPDIAARLELPVGHTATQWTQAVKEFQLELGLNPTGKVDSKTLLNLLSLSASYKEKVLRHALQDCERLVQKVKAQSASKYIEVNLASQVAVGYDYDPATGISTEAVRSDVIVGKVSTQTPIQDFKVWGVKFNPGWSPTTNILKRNLYKNGQLNHKWLAEHRFQIHDKSGASISAADVNPGALGQYRFFEPPGKSAALGVLKLETDSLENIYMHDTPEKSKFDWNNRLASSGCVRVQNIEEMSKWVYGADVDEQKNKSFERFLRTEKNSIKKISEPIPVYITYRLMDWPAALTVYLPDAYGKVGFQPTVVSP